jgi:hypothetical protein
MTLYTFYSESHSVMFWQYMMPSVKGRFTLIGERFPQLCPTGVYKTDGWSVVMRKKITMLAAASSKEKRPFVYSDVDMVFQNFGPEDVLRDLGDSDVACLDDREAGYCTGFMFIRPCREIINLLGLTLELIDKHGCDEPAFNEALPGVQIKARLLPSSIYTSYDLIGAPDWKTFGTARLERLPVTAKVFHANYTVGINEKERLLGAARNAFDNRPCNS